MSKDNVVVMEESHDGLSLEPGLDFVQTPYVEEISERALTYLQTGYPVNFSGPAGVGKTTFAMHVAARLGRPVMLIHGDDEFGTSDLVGGNFGYRKSKLIDNFIHSVLKTEESMSTLWVDNRLTIACKHGYTLIYDEFTRSRPEANNVLLSILSEKILDLPQRKRRGEAFCQDVHPEFRAIFTCNPEEYAGVHKSQDALMDRLITVPLKHFDRETEVEITQAKSGLTRTEAERIVDTIRELRNRSANHNKATIRDCIMIARVLAHRGLNTEDNGTAFQQVCRDILGEDIAGDAINGEPVSKKLGGMFGRVFQSSRKTAQV